MDEERPVITSRKNPAVIRAYKLRDTSFRRSEGCFLADGVKLIREALKFGADICRIYVRQSSLVRISEQLPELMTLDEKVTLLSDECFEKITPESAPQGIVAEIKHLDKWRLFNKIDKKYPFGSINCEKLLVLDGIQDPGNLGTIIRTAAAFGADRVIAGGNCADISSPKALRASMGSAFAISIDYVPDTALAVSQLVSAGRKVYAAVLDKEAKNLASADICESDVFLIGNEGHGISPELASSCCGKIFIPMEKDIESLNAAAAAAVCLWTQYVSEGRV
ncbi:MAG: RNA methyltransferase [Clostridia bacterium]|nr:RNA methyltransferase [Clostridia bacterium]